MGRALLAATAIFLFVAAIPVGAAVTLVTETAVSFAESLPPRTVAESFLSNAGGYVVAMAFAPDGRLLYTTKGGFAGTGTGTVRIVENGQLRPAPFLSRTVEATGERGLLGLALDPNFNQPASRWVYVYVSEPGPQVGTAVNRVYRFLENPATQTATEPGQLLFEVTTGLASNHNGGNLHFGPDGKLYVSVGDLGVPADAQNLASLAGKIHRLNPDGSIPADNPFVGQAGVLPSIWSYGHRNSFDFTFDSRGGRMLFTENGPNCDDEVNLGSGGANYGWPTTYSGGACTNVGGDVDPLYVYPTPIGITGIDVYEGPITAWQGSLFWCAVNTGSLYRASLDGTRTAIVGANQVDGAPSCRVDVQHGPDGALYVTSGETIGRMSTFVPATFVFLPLVSR